MKSTWSKAALKKIRRNLPAGWQSTLATEFSLSTGRVDNILSGQSPKDDVILRAVELANEHQQILSSAKEAIAAL